DAADRPEDRGLGRVARARPAVARGQHPLEHRRQLGPPDLFDVGGRPHERAHEQVPALRLRRAREPGQRPPDLLQRPRLPPPVLDVQGRGRHHRRGADDLPRVRQPPAGPPDPGHPLGRRRHGLFRPGPAHRRRRRARRQVPGRGALHGLGPLRRLRDGRRLDVGGLPARLLLQARQPHSHPRHEPPRPDPRDDGRLERRPLLGPRPRLRLARHRGRRPRPRGHRRRLLRGARQRRPDPHRRQDQEGIRRLLPRRRGRHARQAGDARPGGRGPRRARRHQRPARGRPQAGRHGLHGRRLHRRRRASDLGARRRGSDPRRVRDGPPGRRRRPRGRRRARRRGQQLHLLAEVRRGVPREVLRDVYRRAAAGRRGGRDERAQLRALRLLIRRVLLAGLRLYPDGRHKRRRPQALGKPRRRLHRRGRALPDGAGGHRDDARRPRLDRPAALGRQPDRQARRPDGRHDRHKLYADPAPEN
ncbi:MAG: Transketolase, partial [uncultured Rubrobacteraceae bacterium]